jgi:hypothetical protein
MDVVFWTAAVLGKEADEMGEKKDVIRTQTRCQNRNHRFSLRDLDRLPNASIGVYLK